MATKSVKIPALAGPADVEDLERELHGFEGVVSARVDAAARELTVEWTEAGTSWDALCEFLEEIGYPPAGD